MIVGVPDKKLAKWLEDKGEYMITTDEGEAVSIAAGAYLATKKPSDVCISADGFMNALNPITSWIIPQGIAINLFISIGRTEEQHKIATEIVPQIIDMLKKYDTARIHYQFIE